MPATATTIPDKVYDAALSAISDGALGDQICDNVGEISKARAKSMFKDAVLKSITTNPSCKNSPRSNTSNWPQTCLMKLSNHTGVKTNGQARQHPITSRPPTISPSRRKKEAGAAQVPSAQHNKLSGKLVDQSRAGKDLINAEFTG